jgi:hypothetical protein
MPGEPSTFEQHHRVALILQFLRLTVLFECGTVVWSVAGEFLSQKLMHSVQSDSEDAGWWLLSCTSLASCCRR